MTETQTLILWLIASIGRIPRIVERWKSPFLNGPGWFIGVQVPPGFYDETGRAILARYRLRLFIPWVFEIPSVVLLLATGHTLAVLWLICIVTLLTRFIFYANRKAAEDDARRFEIPGTAPSVAAVSLSLRPRSLKDYTKPWIEALIILALLGSVGSLGYASMRSRGWGAMRQPWTVTLIYIYLQFGALLAKRAFVRARSAAPASNTEKYLIWRESLRRLSTSLCDYVRLLLITPPVIVAVASLTSRWDASAEKLAITALVFVITPVIMWYEWRKRQQHLEVARITKSRELFIPPDTMDRAKLLCFNRSSPALLLKAPNGYALNLASAPARTAALYVAGYVALWLGLTR